MELGSSTGFSDSASEIPGWASVAELAQVLPGKGAAQGAASGQRGGCRGASLRRALQLSSEREGPAHSAALRACFRKQPGAGTGRTRCVRGPKGGWMDGGSEGSAMRWARARAGRSVGGE